MKKIHSKQTNVLLHIIFRKDDMKKGRVDIAPDNEYLQLASLNLDNGKTFKPHKHIENIKHTHITQESWCVISGKVKAILYDVDDTIISEEILNAGDISITFKGGHTYEILEDDTLVYEYKTGPYYGQENDKCFI